jgi:hypothetical protein
MTINKESIRPGISLICVHAILIIGICCIFNLGSWREEGVIQTDAVSYYAYLPAAFIYHDLGLNFLTAPNPPKVNMWPLKTPGEKQVIKTSMGMAVFYAPLFFAAHLVAHLGNEQATGYSPIYHFFLGFSGLLYFYLGLLVLRRILLRYFSERISALTLTAIALGSNMLYYITVETMSVHPAGFFLVNLFIWYTIRWHESQKLRYVIILGISLGLMVLTRPTHILVSILFLFYQVNDFTSLKSKFSLFYVQRFRLLLIPLFVFLIFVPQMLYWKMQTGQYLFNSYIGESFYFGKPHILEGWFSYRKGWLLYTPLMTFFFAGLFVLPEGLKSWRLSIILFFCFSTYVIFSWWCWWYGGGYGARSYIDFYGLFALTLAAFWNKFMPSGKRIYKYATGIVTSLVILLNLFQTYQYKRGVIHFDSMTKEKYWAVFLRLGDETTKSDYLLKAPDYDKARRGEKEY